MNKIMFNDLFNLTKLVIVGRKTMTRRIIDCSKNKVFLNLLGDENYMKHEGTLSYDYEDDVLRIDDDFECYILRPYYKIGEVVAIAQSYKELGYNADALDRSPKDWRVIRGTLGESKGWNNKMFVRAEACKHHIRITNIKVERLQDISYEDCLNEGVTMTMHKSADGEWGRYYWHHGITRSNCPNGQYKEYDTPLEAFSSLIDCVCGKYTWESNPWVLAYEFELIK